MIGKSVDRFDARLKVTGGAKYAADHTADRLAFAAPVVSSVARGRIRSIDARQAEKAPGVIAVFRRENTPRVHRTTNDFGAWTKLGEARVLFEDDVVHYAGQYLAFVVADTQERADAAAALFLKSNTTRRRPPPIPIGRSSRCSFRRTCSVHHGSLVAMPPRRSRAAFIVCTKRTRRPTSITIRWSRPPPSRCGTATI